MLPILSVESHTSTLKYIFMTQKQVLICIVYELEDKIMSILRIKTKHLTYYNEICFFISLRSIN